MHTKLERRETAANLLENTQWRYAYEVERFGECVEGRLINDLSPKDVLEWNFELRYAHSPMGTVGQKYNSDGDEIWTRQLGLADFYGVAADLAGNLYLGGQDPRPPSWLDQFGGTDAFVTKMSAGP